MVNIHCSDSQMSQVGSWLSVMPGVMVLFG